MITETEEMNPYLKAIKRIVDFLEEPHPFAYVLLTFFFGQSLRTFLEGYSAGGHVTFSTYFLYSASYAVGAMGCVLLFYCATRESIEKICRVVCVSFLLLTIVPIIDLLVTMGRGYATPYLTPRHYTSFLVPFMTFFGLFGRLIDPNAAQPLSPGQFIEMGLGIVLGSSYFFLKTRRPLRSIVFTFIGYAAMFSYLAMPFYMRALGITVSHLTHLTYLYLVLAFLLGLCIYYLHDRASFMAILKGVCGLRMIHFMLMFLFGIVIACTYSSGVLVIAHLPVFRLMTCLAAVFFAGLSSLMMHDMQEGIRPEMHPASFNTVMWSSLVIALVYARAVNFMAFFLILIFLANAFLYAMPPLRFKNVPFVSKIFVSGNLLLVAMLGFLVAGGTVRAFPGWIACFFLIGLTAVFNFTDIKNYERDRVRGVKTLPVMLGLERSKFVIGIFFLAAYPVAYLITPKFYMMILLVSFGVTEFLLLQRRIYNETLVFGVYLVSLAAIMSALILHKAPLIRRG